MQFDGKTFLIVGASSGIGLAASLRLARDGAKLVLVSSNPEKLKNAVVMLPGKDHVVYCCDLAMTESIGGIFEYIENAKIRLDGMVFSAGIAPLCLVKDNTADLMDRVFRINFFSFLELVKYFQRETNSKEGSKIVAISSVTARGAGYRQTLYGASKAALNSAVKLMAKELLNRKIHVNCISPGVTATQILDELRANSSGFDENLIKNQPLGPIPPEKIADAVAYLLSDGSDFLTGAEWVLDGGMMLK